jgi:hypothetical protein
MPQTNKDTWCARHSCCALYRFVSLYTLGICLAITTVCAYLPLVSCSPLTPVLLSRAGQYGDAACYD